MGTARPGRVFNGIGIGIGVATGICCVGNLGADQRFNYSVWATTSTWRRASKARPRSTA